MRQSGILVWDCAVCQSKSVDFIQQLQKVVRATFSSVIIAAQDTQSIPPGVSDVAIALPVVTRFGPNATHDAIIDVISHLAQCKGQCTVVLVTHSFPLWINLFQRIEPKGVVFVSSKDPRQCLDFSFLPQSLSVTILGWPNLEQVMSADGVEDDLLEADGEAGEEEDGDDGFGAGGSGGFDDDSDGDEHQQQQQQQQSFNAGIQPLSNLDKYQIDLRSPVGGSGSGGGAGGAGGGGNASRMSDSGEVTPKRGGAGRDQTMEVPLKFRPLIEAMKAMGKAMISLSDLEGQLKIWSAKLNEPIDNTNAYICKAADAQIVIYDKSINYVRFRNRAMANANIEYV